MANKKPDCDKCGYVIVHDNNIKFLEILDKYHILFSNGMGAIQAEVVNIICRTDLTVPWYLFWKKQAIVNDFINKLNIYYTNGMQSRDNEPQLSSSATKEIKKFLDGGNDGDERNVKRC